MLDYTAQLSCLWAHRALRPIVYTPFNGQSDVQGECKEFVQSTWTA
jgi:hypothetical protein